MIEFNNEQIRFFWNNINLALDHQHKTLKDLAIESGLNFKTVTAARWRALKTDQPAYMLHCDTVFALSKALNISAAHLLFSGLTNTDLMNRSIEYDKSTTQKSDDAIKEPHIYNESDLMVLLISLLNCYGISYSEISATLKVVNNDNIVHVANYTGAYVRPNWAEKDDYTITSIIIDMIEQERLSRHISLADLAQKAGLKSANAAFNVLHNKTNSSIQTVFSIIETLGMNLESLQQEAEERMSYLKRTDDAITPEMRMSMKDYLLAQIQSTIVFSRADIIILIEAGWMLLYHSEREKIKVINGSMSY